jgi:hypothetical protein
MQEGLFHKSSKIEAIPVMKKTGVVDTDYKKYYFYIMKI